MFSLRIFRCPVTLTELIPYMIFCFRYLVTMLGPQCDVITVIQKYPVSCLQLRNHFISICCHKAGSHIQSSPENNCNMQNLPRLTAALNRYSQSGILRIRTEICIHQKIRMSRVCLCHSLFPCGCHAVSAIVCSSHRKTCLLRQCKFIFI